MMIGSTKMLAAASFAAVLLTGVAHAFTVPDFKGSDPSIGSPGYPDFWAANFSASLTANSQGTVYTLTIQGSNPNIGISVFKAGFTVSVPLLAPVLIRAVGSVTCATMK